MNAVSIIGVVSAFCLVCLWLLALCAEKGMHPLRRVLRGSRRLPAWEKILLSIFVSVWIAFAGLKDGDGTNGVNQVEGETNTVTQVDGTNTVWQIGGEGTNVIPGGTRFCASSLGGVRPRGSAALPVVTDDDIAVGWRVVSVSSNMLPVATFTMPTNATVWESAQACGRGWGAWHIPLDGWRFTYGDDGWTNGFAWVEGYFRSKFRSRANEIRLLSERLALCPAANWSRYNLTASRAWCATNDVDGLVVTFENAAIGDDPTKIASVQMELFPHTGEVALRYDLTNVGDATYTAGLVVDGTNHFVEVGAGTREVVFQRVHPDDWDMDGLPNSIDDNPQVPSPNTGYNQTDAWAIAAFPSNATDIVSVGYAAWAAARASEPNRHLIGLQVSSPDNVWPICLTFGDKQVMCDGSVMMYFAIDDGARYSFELSDGALVAVDFDGTEMLDGLPVEWPNPWEYQSWPSMVTLHVDSARSGWIGRTAEVELETDVMHIFPDGNGVVTAVVTNCHEDAYIDCTWSGGEGISFSDNHSLTTTINWNSTNGVAWATNYVDLVTIYEGGYAITNHHGITVGGSDVPPLRLSMTGQDVYFLNDYNNGNRTERVYRVSFELQGPRGTTGNLSVDSIGGAEMKFFVDENILQPATNSIRLAIGEDDYFCSTNLYLACPELGRGIVSASFAADGGGVISTSRTCRVIEPLRRFVTNETYPNSRQYVNPSCLVYGTNAILKVDVRTGYGASAGFGPGEVKWKWISGPCTIQSNGWYAVVTPTATNGDVEIEARFNEDEIQPRFKLPIVVPKTVNIRAYTVRPPREQLDKKWEEGSIRQVVETANEIYTQVGIRFELLSIQDAIATNTDWIVRDREIEVDGNGRTNKVVSAQTRRLFSSNHSNDAIDIIFTGAIEDPRVVGFKCDFGVVLGKQGRGRALAHELGHMLGLKDCYDRVGEGGISKVIFGGENNLIPQFFDSGGQDWGLESRRGFYGLENDLPNVLGTLLMYGWKGDWRVDIPMFGVTGLPEGAGSEWLTDKIKVGAHYIDFRATKGEGSSAE